MGWCLSPHFESDGSDDGSDDDDMSKDGSGDINTAEESQQNEWYGPPHFIVLLLYLFIFLYYHSIVI